MRVGIQQILLILTILLVLVGTSATSRALAADELRTWSEAKGKYKIKAKFVKLEDEVVTLEKDDGDEIEIELKKLSTADQKFVADAVKAADDSPFKAKSSDPFKPKPKGDKKPAKEEKDNDEESGDMKLFKPKMSAGKQIKLVSPGKWKVDVPSAEPQTSTGEKKVIALPGKRDFWEKFNGLAVGHGEAANTAVASYSLEQRAGVLDNKKEITTRLVVCDLETGKAGPPIVTPGQYGVLAVYDDGAQVLMRRMEFGFGKNDLLEVWKLKGGTVSKVLAFAPYDFERAGDAARDVVWAAFINKERLVTCSNNGKVIFWRFPDIQPISGLDLSLGSVPALSPDRKLLVYSNGPAVGIFDVVKQKIVAQQQAPASLFHPKMAFSPSGKRIASVAHDKVLVWDTASGKLEHTIPDEGIHFGGHIQFPDDDFVLAGNSCLLDIKSEMKVWTYNGVEQIDSVAGLVVFGKETALIPTRLPHPAAKTLLQTALTDPSQFVLKAGTTVRIDVSGITEEAQRDRVIKGLTKQLGAIQCTVDPKGTIDLFASVEGPTEVDVSYRGLGDHKFKEYRTNVRFLYQNLPAWESSRVNTPGVVSLKQGESVEAYLRAREKPDYEFFDRISFPKFLPKPVAGQPPASALTLGTSNITANGIQ